MNSHWSDAEKISLIEEGKKIGINEVIKRNEVINNSLRRIWHVVILKILKKYSFW